MRKYAVGQVFGRLTLTRKLANVRNNSVWECLCDCGNISKVLAFCLGNGNTRSCGMHSAHRLGNLKRTHGLSRTSEYASWFCMMNRCYKEADKSYHQYGGRGITVCQRWSDVRNFVEDMGPRPRGMSIDRVDVNGNYEPGNCRWATAVEQASNRRNSRYVDYRGCSVTVAEASRRAGMRPKAFLRSTGQPYSRKQAQA